MIFVSNDNKKSDFSYQSAFDCCVDFLVTMIEKYGPEVLAEINSEKEDEKKAS